MPSPAGHFATFHIPTCTSRIQMEMSNGQWSAMNSVHRAHFANCQSNPNLHMQYALRLWRIEATTQNRFVHTWSCVIAVRETIFFLWVDSMNVDESLLVLWFPEPFAFVTSITTNHPFASRIHPECDNSN